MKLLFNDYRYKKRITAKDASRYSKQDLNQIFGRSNSTPAVCFLNIQSKQLNNNKIVFIFKLIIIIINKFLIIILKINQIYLK